MVVVPLSHNGTLVGVLKMVSKRPSGFDARRVQGLRLMAGVLASCLSHAAEFDSKRRLLVERAGALCALNLVNERLRESQERFRSAFDYAAIGMAVVGLDGRWMMVNRSICRIVGYTEQELLARDFQSITHPPDLHADLACVRQLLAGEISDYQMLKRYVHRQGHLVWVQLSVSLVRDIEGNPLHFISQIQDVTAQKQAEDALRASEEEYRTTFELAGVGKAQADLQTGRFIRVNAKLCEMLGYSADELLGRRIIEITHPDDVADTLASIKRLSAGNPGEYAAEKRYLHKNGHVVWISLTAAVIRDGEGRAVRAVSTMLDVTARKRAEALEEDRRRVLEMIARDMPLADVLEKLADAVERQVPGGKAAILSLQDGVLQLHAPALPEEWRDAISRGGLRLAAGLAADVPYRPEPGFAVSFIASSAPWKKLRSTAGRLGLAACWTLGIQSSDGSSLGLFTLYHPEARGPDSTETQILCMAASLASICIEHHNTTRHLAHLVRHDALTGLPNRLCFEDRLGQAIAMARRSKRQVGLLVLDVDHFKWVNDTLGHEAGDSILQQFAQRLLLQLRETDTMARMGGDEFMIVLPEVSGADPAVVVAQRLLASLQQPFVVNGRELQITTSIGIALYPNDGHDSITLQRQADLRMYETKRRGRNDYTAA